MKITHSILRYFPAMGGVEEYVRRYSEGLSSLGHQVEVFASDLKFEREGLLEDKQKNINGVNITRFKPFKFKPRGYVIPKGMFNGLLKNKADIIHGHAYMHYPADCALLVSKFKKIPFVFNPFFVDLGVNSLCRCFYKNSLGKMLMKADAVIVISDFEEKIIRDNGLKPKRVEVIHPVINIKELEYVKDNIFDSFGLKDNIVLFVGRLDFNKGVDLLLNAASLVLKQIPEARFVLIGPDWGYRQQLDALAKELKIEDKIMITGSLPRKDLISAYKHATVFAFPSRYELFGIVLIEAMAAGLPVVTSDCSAMPFVVKNNQTGLLFENNNYSSLAEKILKLLRTPALRQELALKAKKTAVEEYALEKNLKKLELIYKSLLN